jgi:hypothetical protein
MAQNVSTGLKRNARALVMFCLGLLIGGGAFLFASAYKIDGYLRERSAVYYANNQKMKEILKLQEELGRLSHPRELPTENEKIKKIRVEVLSERPILAEAIQSQVEEKLRPFLGKSSSWVSNNPDLVETVLEKQEIHIDETQHIRVRIHVKYLSFYRSSLKIWVKAEEISDEGVSNLGK